MATVDSIQSSSQSLMTAQYDTVKSFLDTLAAFTKIDDVNIPDADNPLTLLDDSFATQVFQTLDDFRPQTIPEDPPSPTAPTLDALVDIQTPTFDTLDALSAAPYTPVIPATPSAALPSMPSAPSLASHEPPSAPSFSLPAAPTFTAIAIPDSLGIDVPTFQYTTPVSDLTAPTELFSFNEQDYTSVLSDAVKVKLLNDIENGGYGIEVADERDLWDRARERTTIEANARIETALSAAAARGFALPPGADLAIIAEAQQDALEKIASVDRDIALKRADMYVENRKFSIQAANEVESMFINYRSAMMERMLNAAKSLVELGIAVFNAKRDKFMSDLEAYKAYAAVYESKIRGELTKIELFKGQIEAARGKIEIQQGMVDIYKAQLSGVQTLIDVYKAQMDGTRILMEIERDKLDVFNAQMTGYTAQVQAKSAEFGLYESQVRGELSKLQAYSEQVRAYEARVAAYQARISAETSKVSAQSAANSARIDRYRGQLDKYKADWINWQAKTQADLEKYRGDIALFGVRSDNYAKQLDFGFRANVENNLRNNKFVDRQIAEVERTTNALFKLMDWRLNSAKYGTDAATQLAVAAAQQITGLTSLLTTA